MYKETRYHEKEVFITEDGKEFENPDDARKHEKLERDQEILDSIPKLRSNRRPGNYYYITNPIQLETVIRVYGRKYGDPYQIRELRKHRLPFVVAVIDPSLNGNPKLVALPFTDFEADYKFFKLVKADIEDALKPKRVCDADKTLLKDIILICKGYYNQKVFSTVNEALGEYYCQYVSLYDVNISDKVIIMKLFVPALNEISKKYPDRLSAKDYLDFIVNLSLSDGVDCTKIFEFFVNLFKNISFTGKALIPMNIDSYIERGKIKNIVDFKSGDLKEEDEEPEKKICTIRTEVTNGTVDKELVEIISGEDVSLVITPDEGFELYAATINGESVNLKVDNGIITLVLTKVTEDTVIAVIFSKVEESEPEIPVEPEVPEVTKFNISSTATNGTVDNEKAEADAGESLTLTFTPDEGFDSVEATKNGEPLEVSIIDGVVTISLTDIHTDVELVVVFSKSVQEPEPEVPEVTKFTINASAINGTVDKDTVEVTSGESLTLTFTPDEGFDSVEATKNGEPLEVSLVDGSVIIVITEIVENMDIVVTFSKSVQESEPGDETV